MRSLAAQVEQVLNPALERFGQGQRGSRRGHQTVGLDRADPGARQARSPRQLLLRPAAANPVLAEIVLDPGCLRHDRISCFQDCIATWRRL